MGEFIFWIILVIGATWVGEQAGLYNGRIQVASGQYTCELITNTDLTTQWQCKETE